MLLEDVGGGVPAGPFSVPGSLGLVPRVEIVFIIEGEKHSGHLATIAMIVGDVQFSTLRRILALA